MPDRKPHSDNSGTATAELDAAAMRDEFLERVNKLLDQCEEWTREADPKAIFKRETATISEEAVGEYEVPVLVIDRPGYETVRIEPRGRWIIGADGRVDIASSLGREVLIYLPAGGYSLSFRFLTDTGKVFTKGRNPLEDLGIEGWHYVQSRKLRYYPVVDQELFYLLLEVTGR